MRLSFGAEGTEFAAVFLLTVLSLLLAAVLSNVQTQLTFSRVHWAEPEIFCAHCNSAAKHRHFKLLADHLACLISLLSNVLQAPTAYLSLCV